MKRLLCFVLIASALLAQPSGTSLPPMAAVIVSPNLPVFAAMPVRPNFSPVLLVFHQRMANDFAFELTVNYADGDKQTTLAKTSGCDCSPTATDWRQLMTITLRSKPVASVAVSLVTAGTPVSITLSQ
ncbi:MAG: hypothetical protein IPJ98_06205 [Bryobacterales bacterium]|nr:hypothetical protein [Bryobacterales bacterium]